MLTAKRLRELRKLASLRQEELAVLFGIGIATVNRWERKGGTRPSGLHLQLYRVMEDTDSKDLERLRGLLLGRGNLVAIHWLLGKSLMGRSLGRRTTTGSV